VLLETLGPPKPLASWLLDPPKPLGLPCLAAPLRSSEVPPWPAAPPKPPRAGEPLEPPLSREPEPGQPDGASVDDWP
jgi:hypothetical protein